MNVFKTETYRNDDGTTIERDIPDGDFLAAGEFFLPFEIPLNTPAGQMPLPVRVHLRGAESAQHAFENLQALFNANIRQDAEAAKKRYEDIQRKAMLAQGAQGMPPLRADGAGRRKG